LAIRVDGARSRTVAHATPPSLTRGRRTAALITVCVSLMVITIDVTILNVALPTLADALDAGNSALQWFINAYELAFAGLLLTAGALGDRFGRRRALAIGLAIFGTGSALSALAGSPGQLIATRVVMGLGGALVLPATLSIVTNVFTDPSERARAIAVWAGVAALGLGLGPLVGGWLLQRFYWGSVFLINVPIAIAALVAGRLTIPESRNPSAARLDPLGAALSVVGLGALLFAVTEGPDWGWSSPATVAGFVLAAAGLAAFAAWELHVDQPMLNIEFFRNPRFSGAIVAIMALFFGLLALMFVSTQTLQSVLAYDTLGAGARLVPLPAMFFVFAQISVRIAARVGTKRVVTAGLVIAAAGLGVASTFDVGSGYGALALALGLTGIGMGCTIPPATESLMGSVPRQRAGVASAVNDSTRLTAGAIGVAVVGSVVSSTYHAAFAGTAATGALPPGAVERAQASIASAGAVAHELGGTAGQQLLAAARQGFVDGASTGLLIASAVAALGAVVAWRYLPASADPTSYPNPATSVLHCSTAGRTPSATASSWRSGASSDATRRTKARAPASQKPRRKSRISALLPARHAWISETTSNE
jgi:EmrB/QacA subfamily drug resistance transporter